MLSKVKGYFSRREAETDLAGVNDDIDKVSALIVGHKKCLAHFDEYIHFAAPEKIHEFSKCTLGLKDWVMNTSEKKYGQVVNVSDLVNAFDAYWSCTMEIKRLHKTGQRDYAVSMHDDVLVELSRDVHAKLRTLCMDLYQVNKAQGDEVNSLAV